jgi:hypothetical protein
MEKDSLRHSNGGLQVKATTQIFLSYAREDEERVENLYRKLSDAGFKPWMDKKDILPGEKWKPCIQEAIRHSDFFLACLSANSVSKRGYLQKEIKDALDIWQEKLDSDIYLIPVRLEDCEVPESLRDFQWVNMFKKGGWPRLVRAIQVGMERRAEVPADEEPPPDTEMATPKESPQRAPKMDAQKHRRRQCWEVVWHGIIGNTAYDIMKRVLVALWFIIGPWLISLGQHMLGAAIPSVQDALSTEVVLTVGTISTAILWFPFGIILCFLFGFIFAGLVGFVSTRILWHWGRVTAIRRPPDMTPRQVLVDGCKNLLILSIFFGVGICFFATVSVFGWEKFIAFVRSVMQP